MHTADLLHEIDNAFPGVPKPEGLALSFHKDNCPHCEYLRNDLAEFTGTHLPPQAFRLLCHEMSCLSPQGWRWVLPSYLPFCLHQDTGYDPMETEFLIYSLAPSQEHEADARIELSAMSRQQLKCLVHFLEWCQSHPHWSDYCPQEIERGIEFLSSLRANEA